MFLHYPQASNTQAMNPPPPPARKLHGLLPAAPSSPKPGVIAADQDRQALSTLVSDEALADPVRVRWLQIRFGGQVQPNWKAGVDECYTVWFSPGSVEDLRGVHCGGYRAWQALELRLPPRWYDSGVCVRRFESLEAAVAAFFDPQAVSPRVNLEIDRRSCWIYYWTKTDSGELRTEVLYT